MKADGLNLGTRGSLIGLTPETAELTPDAMVGAIEVGSKALFVAWICYTSFLWSMKGTLLCFYSRIT